MYGDVRSIPYEFTYRCVYDWDGVEDKKNFFQSYKIMNQNLIQIKEDFYPICFNVKSPKKKKKKHLLKIQYDFLLGQENGQFVYWNQHRDLLIVYVQESKRRMIEQMIQKWSSTKRVRILNVLDHLSFFQSDEYMKNQYDWDVVWVGQGFMDYGFYIKRKGNGIHGDLWYWDEKECRTLEWVEYG